MRVVAAAACIGLLWLVVVGIGGGAHVPQPSVEGEQHAVQRWGAFPVDASPRPIVLILGPVEAPSVFRTADSEAAFEARRLVVRAHVPGEWRGTQGQALISGREALRRLLLRRPGSGSQRQHRPTLTIDSISQGSGKYLTDRGVKRLLAWRFYLRGFQTPALVLALAGRRVYSDPNLAQPTEMVFSKDESATGNASSNTLRVWVVGAPAGQGPCTAAYRISSLATNRAIAIGVSERDNPQPADRGCLGFSESNAFTVHLRRPLGNRVVVASPSGGVIPVTASRVSRP